MRLWLSRFALWRDKRLRFRADWWRDLSRWLSQGGTFRRIRSDRERREQPPVRTIIEQPDYDWRQ